MYCLTMLNKIKNTIFIPFLILMGGGVYAEETIPNANEDTRHYTHKVFRSKTKIEIQKNMNGDCVPYNHKSFNETDLSFSRYNSIDDCIKSGGKITK